MTAHAEPEASSTKQPHKPQLKRAPWGPLTAIFYAVFVYFAAQIAASLILVGYSYVRGWGHAQRESWLTNTVTAQFWYVLLAEALTVGAVWWLLRQYKTSLRRIGWRRLRWSDGGMALGGYIVYFLVYAVVLSVAMHLLPGLNVNQKQELGFDNPTGTINLILTFLSLVVLPPLAEETVFRGFVYTGMRTKLRPLWAAVVTSALFASAHLEIGSGQALLWTAALDTFILSLVLCYLREKTGKIWAGVFVHGLKNLLAFWVLYMVPLVQLHFIR